MTKKDALRHYAYLKEMTRLAGIQLRANEIGDLQDILNEIDGTSALLREYAEERAAL